MAIRVCKGKYNISKDDKIDIMMIDIFDIQEEAEIYGTEEEKKPNPYHIDYKSYFLSYHIFFSAVHKVFLFFQNRVLRQFHEDMALDHQDFLIHQ